MPLMSGGLGGAQVFKLVATIQTNAAMAIRDIHAVNAAGKRLSVGLSRSFAALGKIAKVAFVAAGVAAAGIFVAAIKKAADFEMGMAKVKAISGATAEEFEALTEEAERLGLATAQTMTDIAEGMEQFSRAGFTATETIAAMGGAVALAESQTMGLGSAVAITAAILNQMHLPAEESARVVNALAAAASSSATTVETLSESMKYLGPVAQRLGVPLEEALAIIGKLGDAGIKGGFATRAFSTALGELASPTEEAAEVMEDLGIKYFDANGEFIGITNTVGVLEKAFVGMNTEQKEVALGAMFTGAAVRVFSTLLGVGADELHNYQDELTDTTVAFDQQAAMLDTLKGQWMILKGSIELLLVTIGRDMLPILKGLVQDRIIPLVNNITKWIDAQGGLVGSLQEVKRRILEAVPILGTLAKVFVATFGWIWKNKRAIVMAFAAIGAAMVAMKIASLINPLNLLIAAIAGVIAGMALLKPPDPEPWEEFKETIDETVESLKALGEAEIKAWMDEYIRSVRDGILAMDEFRGAGQFAYTVIAGELNKLRIEVGKLQPEDMADAWIIGVDMILAKHAEMFPSLETLRLGYLEVADAMAATVNPMQAHIDALAESKRVLAEYRATQYQLTETTEDGTDVIDENADAVEELVTKYAELLTALSEAKKGSFEYAQALMALGKYHDELVEAAEYLEGQNEEVAESLRLLIKQTAIYKAVQKEAEEEVEKTVRTMADLRKEYDELTATIATASVGSIEHADALEGLQGQYEELMNAVDTLLKYQQPVSDEIREQIALLESQGVVTRAMIEADEELLRLEEEREAQMKEAKKLAEELRLAEHGLWEETQALIETYHSAIEGGELQADTLERLLGIYDEVAGKIELMGEYGVKTSEELLLIKDALQEIGIMGPTVMELMVEKIQKSFSAMGIALEGIFSSITSKISDAVNKNKEIQQKWADTTAEIHEQYREDLQQLAKDHAWALTELGARQVKNQMEYHDYVNEKRQIDDGYAENRQKLHDEYRRQMDEEDQQLEDQKVTARDVLKSMAQDFLAYIKTRLLGIAADMAITSLAAFAVLNFATGIAAGAASIAALGAAAGLALAGFERGAMFDRPTVLPAHVVAERGVSEAYLPLTPRVLGDIGVGIADALSASPELALAAVGETTINVEISGSWAIREEADIGLVSRALADEIYEDLSAHGVGRY